MRRLDGGFENGKTRVGRQDLTMADALRRVNVIRDIEILGMIMLGLLEDVYCESMDLLLPVPSPTNWSINGVWLTCAARTAAEPIPSVTPLYRSSTASPLSCSAASLVPTTHSPSLFDIAAKVVSIEFLGSSKLGSKCLTTLALPSSLPHLLSVAFLSSHHQI